LKLKRIIRRIFFPERCRQCKEIIPIGKERCSCGFSDVLRVSLEFCEHCGTEKDFCNCYYNGSAFLPHITAPFLYSGAIKERIYDLKFNHKPDEADFLGREMSLRFAKAYPLANIDYVTFIPMTETNLAERGYNQSELLAERVATELDFKKADLLFKVKDTLSQHNLSKSERLTNLNGAFAVNECFDLKNKTVLLCDDIKTTGTTLKKCCDTLFASGAKDVYCLCAAVTEFFVPVSHSLKVRSNHR